MQRCPRPKCEKPQKASVWWLSQQTFAPLLPYQPHHLLTQPRPTPRRGRNSLTPLLAKVSNLIRRSVPKVNSALDCATRALFPLRSVLQFDTTQGWSNYKSPTNTHRAVAFDYPHSFQNFESRLRIRFWSVETPGNTCSTCGAKIH